MRSDPAIEVIDVQLSDDVEPGEPFSSPAPPPWRSALGTMLALALVVGAVFAVVNHTAPSPSRSAADERVIRSARAALEAWGHFGTSGDLGSVAPYFDESGPQFAELADESQAIAPHPSGPPKYFFTLSGARVLRGSSPDERIVRGDVVASRANESDQQFQWDLVLRHGSENRWLLWTVRDRRSSASAGAGPASPAR